MRKYCAPCRDDGSKPPWVLNRNDRLFYESLNFKNVQNLTKTQKTHLKHFLPKFSMYFKLMYQNGHLETLITMHASKIRNFNNNLVKIGSKLKDFARVGGATHALNRQNYKNEAKTSSFIKNVLMKMAGNEKCQIRPSNTLIFGDYSVTNPVTQG